MEAELSVASDCEDSSFYIRICVDKGDGKWLLLRDDIASLAYDSPYSPGYRRKLRYRFADHAFRLSKGDRLRVDISGASEHFAPHPNMAGDAFRVRTPRIAHNKVFADESSLILHVDSSVRAHR
jgi:predicted acyl esterase